MSDEYLIWSNHHKAWFGPNGSGYTRLVERAGRYELGETKQWLTRGCGCCLVPEVPVPAPSPDVLGDAAALARYARYQPLAATLKAKRAGRVKQLGEDRT